MQHNGITNVYALKGGLHAWENANYPVQKGDS
jgi:rhodanese-related sulfurtransferase